MSMIIAALLLIVHYVSCQTTPTLWGSRVVSKASGPSDEMVFDVTPKDLDIFALPDGEKEALPVTLDTTNDQCKIDNEIVGNPCKIVGEKLTIKASDVAKQRAFVISNTNGLLMAIFAPNCKFPEAKAGDVDVATSLPLSRFAKNKKEVELNFAVHGADSKVEVQLLRNMDLNPMCHYRGDVLPTVSDTDPCPPLVKDASSDLQKLTIIVKKQAADKDTFLWTTSANHFTVSVSVDWTQDGEYEECKSATTTTVVTATTTSAASAVIYKMGVNMGLLVILLYFRK